MTLCWCSWRSQIYITDLILNGSDLELTQGQKKTRLPVKAGVVLSKLLQAIVDCVPVFGKLDVVTFHLPCRLQLFECREGAPECWELFRQEMVLYFLRILACCVWAWPHIVATGTTKDNILPGYLLHSSLASNLHQTAETCSTGSFSQFGHLCAPWWFTQTIHQLRWGKDWWV